MPHGNPSDAPTRPTRRASGLYTSGEVAVLLGCAPRTVTVLMADGQFPHAYRLHTHGEKLGDRRIPAEDVAAYCRRQGRRLPPELTSITLLIGVSADLRGTITAVLPRCEYAANGFVAGCLAQNLDVAVAVVDAAELGSDAARGILAGLAACRPEARLVALLAEDADPDDWRMPGAVVLKHPCGAETVVEAVR